MKVPCKDCLILPICNNIAKESVIGYMLVYELTVRCSIMSNFIDDNANHTFKKKVSTVAKFYNVPYKRHKWKGDDE